MSKNRRPGRPKGRTSKNYNSQLEVVAKLKVEDPGLSNRKAFLAAIAKHGVVGASNDANLKGLQRAWSDPNKRQRYLREAQAQKGEARPIQTNPIPNHSGLTGLELMLRQQKMIDLALSGPVQRQLERAQQLILSEDLDRLIKTANEFERLSSSGTLDPLMGLARHFSN